MPKPVIGAPAPDIRLDDVHGNPWRLSEHRSGLGDDGKTVVVIFHRHIH